MLTAMLCYGGLEKPVLVEQYDPMELRAFPNSMAYNYVIAAVETQVKSIINASDKFSTQTFCLLNRTGRKFDEKNGTSDVVDLMPKVNSTTKVMKLPR
jgi:hypothetical protein